MLKFFRFISFYSSFCSSFFPSFCSFSSFFSYLCCFIIVFFIIFIFVIDKYLVFYKRIIWECIIIILLLLFFRHNLIIKYTVRKSFLTKKLFNFFAIYLFTYLIYKLL